MYKTLTQVAQSVANSIHYIHEYLVLDKSIDFGGAYPRNSDLFQHWIADY